METTQRTSDGNQAVAVTANLRLDNGGVIQLEAAWGLPGDFPTDIDARLRLVADRGELSIDIHEQGIRAFGDALGYPVPVATPMYGKTQGALHEELDAFVRAVRGEIPLPITMRDGAAAVHLAAAIDKVVRTGTIEEVTYST
jgi:predicted dehydrogenase